MFQLLNTYRRYLIFFSFLLIIFSGLFSVKDYGVSSDESDQRHSGFVELNYIGEKIAPSILSPFAPVDIGLLDASPLSVL